MIKPETQIMGHKLALGAKYLGEGQCRFCVWAPLASKVDVHLLCPSERMLPLTRDEKGYHCSSVNGVEPGALYFYRLDGDRERPDPASRFQPQGVHGPSQVMDSRFSWTDKSWLGLPLRQYIIYELHVGTFTSEGTFDAIVPKLDELIDLGITAVELMPIAQFPGCRNWGYDGVYPFAVQNSYGGPVALKRLVDTCHNRGLAVVLDVVYNHLGPEGNYLWDFAHYFTDRYRTPWGASINFDAAHSDEVRRFFIENAIYWINEFHIDALRIDAVHAIFDFSARTFLEELATAVHDRAEKLNRRVYLIAESSLNDTRLIHPRELGGFGLDAQWNDDFHHALHTLLTGEGTGYYQDFGRISDLVKALREGFVYTGQYSSYRQRRHGMCSCDIPAQQFVVFAQNHDQVGNRMNGERLSVLVTFEALKLAAGVVFLSPFIPLVFMGEEYGESAPFTYFVSHSDPDLIEAVQRGRREEFAAFQWVDEPPDPQSEATFLRAKLNHHLRKEGHHRVLLKFHQELIRLRRKDSALAHLSKDDMEVLAYPPLGSEHAADRDAVFILRRRKGTHEAIAIFNFSLTCSSVVVPIAEGNWTKGLDSAEERWCGPGSSIPADIFSKGEVSLVLSSHAFVLFIRREETSN